MPSPVIGKCPPKKMMWLLGLALCGISQFAGFLTGQTGQVMGRGSLLLINAQAAVCDQCTDTQIYGTEIFFSAFTTSPFMCRFLSSLVLRQRLACSAHVSHASRLSDHLLLAAVVFVNVFVCAAWIK